MAHQVDITIGVRHGVDRACGQVASSILRAQSLSRSSWENVS